MRSHHLVFLFILNFVFSFFFLQILGKTPPFGNELIAAVSKLPKYELTLSIERGSGRVNVQQTNSNFDRKAIMDRLAVVIGDSSNNLLYFNDNVLVACFRFQPINPNIILFQS